nr:hypothetical protein [Deltaproteobacteria bacterium]
VYMSPEQCRGNSDDIDHRSDIYALGCVLFHMLTGRAPFEHDAPGDFIVSHMQHTPPLASSLVPALPPMVDEILMRCLAKSPVDRFQSMGELCTALGNAMDRISTPGVATALARPALVLGAGYRSVYDANVGSAVVTRDATPQRIDSNEMETPRLKPSLLKFFAVAAVLLLVIGAVIVSRVEVGGTSAIAEPAYRYTTPVDTTAPRAQPPAAAVTRTEEAVQFPELDDTVEPSATPAQEVHPKKVHKPKPKPRAIRRQAPSRPQAPEDLYDTR